MKATRSQIFERYNAGRRMVREGVIEAGRLNRGLGLAQRKASEPKYNTTASSCDCKDSFYRPWQVCKHRLALVLVEA